MAYVKVNYPEFTDLKVYHDHGFDSHELFYKMAEFIQDPAHAHFRYIDSKIHYMDACHPAHMLMPETTDPAENLWVEIIIIYTE